MENNLAAEPFDVTTLLLNLAAEPFDFAVETFDLGSRRGDLGVDQLDGGPGVLEFPEGGRLAILSQRDLRVDPGDSVAGDTHTGVDDLQSFVGVLNQGVVEDPAPDPL